MRTLADSLHGSICKESVVYCKTFFINNAKQNLVDSYSFNEA